MKAISVVFLLMNFLGIYYGNAQHCTPGFHFTVDGYTVIFDDQSTADGDITTYSWEFGDGQNSDEQNPTHTYATEGTFNVCLTITADNPGCSATFCHHVVIHDPPPGNCHAAFTAHQPDPDEQIIDFTDESTSDGTIGSWLWDFGDDNTSTEQNPSHTYAEPGNYLVCLTITDGDGGCTSHVCHEITVHHPAEGVCHASFIAHQTDPEQQTIVFTNQSTSDGIITSWFWDFGDGNSSTEQNPSHTYQEPGTYLVCLHITDDSGCTSHVCHNVVVHHPPARVCHALFAANQPDEDELTINFTDLSTSDGIIGSWLWEFGDGNTSTDQNPSHTYDHAGTYLVCLFITDDDGGCTSHFCHHVTLHEIPSVINNSVHSAAIDNSHFGYKINPPTSPKPTALNPLQSIVQSKLNGEISYEGQTYILIYPNPVIGEATINYDLAYDADVKLEVYNILGEMVFQTNYNTEEMGMHSKSFYGQDLQSGSYIIKMVVYGEVFTTRIVIVN